MESRASCQHCQYDRDCPRGKICNRSKCDPDPWADYSDVDCNGAGSCHIDNVGNETGQDYVGVTPGNQNGRVISSSGNQGRSTGVYICIYHIYIIYVYI